MILLMNGCDLIEADETTDFLIGQTMPYGDEFTAHPRVVEIGEHYRRGLVRQLNYAFPITQELPCAAAPTPPVRIAPAWSYWKAATHQPTFPPRSFPLPTRWPSS